MRACGLNPENAPEMRATDFYTSHEALLLGYEQAMTRVDSTTGDWYATSGHMLWIGDRTRQPDDAHVEYCRGIKNPIGLKCGPTLTADDLLRCSTSLNPTNEPGRLTLIGRFGADKVAEHLPRAGARGEAGGPHRASGPAIPCTATPSRRRPATRPGRSTASCRRSRASSRCIAAEGTHAGGVHLEMTGENVTECTGGARAITEDDLSDRYHTYCDPRLNAEQALELAFLVAELLKKARAGKAAPAGRGGGVRAPAPRRPGQAPQAVTRDRRRTGRHAGASNRVVRLGASRASWRALRQRDSSSTTPRAGNRVRVASIRRDVAPSPAIHGTVWRLSRGLMLSADAIAGAEPSAHRRTAHRHALALSALRLIDDAGLHPVAVPQRGECPSASRRRRGGDARS